MIYSHSMDQDLRKLIEENNQLIKENLELTRENQKKIKKIRLFIRRTMVGKILYWILIIVITASAFYLSKPYINNAVKSYNELKDKVDRSTEIISDPGVLFKDINIIEKLIGS